MIRVLVTGGAGFIGSHVLELLTDMKDYQVVAIDNLHTGSLSNIPQGIDFINEDICSPNILNIFKQQAFDAVIHLAAQTMVPFSLEHPDVDCSTNLMGLINILEAARLTGVKSVVFSSSAAVYGNNDTLPLRETAELCPTSFYGLTKMTSEHYLRIYYDLYGINTTVLRFANVYGERQGNGGEGGVVCVFSKNLADDMPLCIFGSGEQTRDFVYVKDVAVAIVKALGMHGHGVYNVSTGNEVSINALTRLFEKVSGKKVQVQYLPSRTGDIYRSCLDNSALRIEMGVTPAYTLEEGLENTYHYFASLER